MPTPTFNSCPATPSLAYSTPRQDSSRQSSWKSVFRLPSSSFKKTTSSVNGVSTMHLETENLSYSAFSSVAHTPLTPNPSMSQSSYFQEPRTSYNSSNSHSTDSYTGLNFKGPQYHFPRSPQLSSSDQPTSTPTMGRLRQHAKSTVARPHPPVKQIPQSVSADPTQSSFSRGYPTRSKTNAPLSPKSVTASASRFLRRVASAPNAKGLFSMGMRSSTKNGFLTPNEYVPPLPPLSSGETDQGQDSLETISSTSSRGARMTSSRHVSPKPPPLIPKFQQGLVPPNRAAFRRTYSSNSIKVRQVRRYQDFL